MICFDCQGCKKRYNVQDELAGKRVRCPVCGQRTRLPGGEEGEIAAAEQGDSSPSGSMAGDPETVPSTEGRPAERATGGPRQALSPQSRAYLAQLLAPAQAENELGRLGPYRVLRVLGAGGMGVVLLGQDPFLKRLVALKVMRPEVAANPRQRQRFIREAQVVASIKHDHIVTIYQVGEERATPFLAMEFLEGESLKRRLKRAPALEPAQIVRIGREIAEGLAAAHARKLIHRDIKPANIWLEGKAGRVKILDFGLAQGQRAGDTRLTQVGTLVGTVGFMSPEQAGGRELDGRCDLFSLGCVLYQMCTGELAFKGSDTLQIIAALVHEIPRPVREINPRVPEGLSRLVQRLLEKDPKDRPANAQAVAEELAQLQETLKSSPVPVEDVVEVVPIPDDDLDEDELQPLVIDPRRSRAGASSFEPQRKPAAGMPPALLIGAAAVGICLFFGMAGIILYLLFASPSFAPVEQPPPVAVVTPAPAPPVPNPTPRPAPPPVAVTPVPPPPAPVVTPVPTPAPPPVVVPPVIVQDPFQFLQAKIITAGKLTGQQVFEKMLPGTVHLVGEGSAGAGVLVNVKDRLVVTTQRALKALQIDRTKVAATAPIVFNDQLVANGPIDPVRKSFCKIYPYKMHQGERIIIDLQSAKFDSYLRLDDSKGAQLAFDDDGGGFPHARIDFTAPRDDEYRIYATALATNSIGPFTLRITSVNGRWRILPLKDQVVPVAFGTDAKSGRIKAKVVHAEPTKDLVLLQLPELPARAQALPLARESARPGQLAHGVTSPPAMAGSWAYTAFTVRSVPSVIKIAGSTSPDARVFLAQGNLGTSDSGVPLTNEAGELVAIGQMSTGVNSPLAYFIDVGDIKALLGSRGFTWIEPEATAAVAKTRYQLDKADLARLTGLLDHAQPTVRARAATLLGEEGPKAKDSVAALSRALQDTDPGVRREAAQALGAIGPEAAAATESLAQLLRDPDRLVRLSAVQAIDHIGPNGASLATALTAVLNEADPELTKQGLVVLAKMGADARPAVPALGRILASPDRRLQHACLDVLAHTGPDGAAHAAALLSWLGSADVESRLTITRLLVSWERGKEAASVLLPRLKEQLAGPDAVCLEGLKLVETLGKYAEGMGAPVAEAYRQHKDAPVRLQALKALAALGEQAEPAVPALVQDLANQELRSKEKALHEQIGPTLVRIGKAAVPALVKLATEGKTQTQRTAALRCIGEIGPAARDAALRPLQAHQETSPDMQEILRETISRLK